MNRISDSLTMAFPVTEIVSKISIERLSVFAKKASGLRHAWENFNALNEKGDFIAETLRACDLFVEDQEVPFHGRTYRNIIATQKGVFKDSIRILLGAHYDAASGSPGADDNASGVAVMLEAACILQNLNIAKSVQFVAFTLEEPQPQAIHFLVGSNHFAKNSRKTGIKYNAVIILESVGYTDHEEGSQVVPLFVRIPVPSKGNFLGVVANRKSEKIMKDFCSISNQYVPELPLVPYKVPFNGKIIPETRFSDHAPFWDQGYPALMLTDTAMFRNPHYHTLHDRLETLDLNFMLNITKAVVSAILTFCDNTDS